MVRLAIRGLLAHKLRFAMTTFAVVMGVGFVVGSFVVTDSLRRSIDSLLTDATAGVDVSVRAESELGATVARARVPEELEAVVAAVDGVEVAAGSVGGYAQLLDADGEPLTSTGAPFLGVSWGEDDRLYPVTLDEGRKPEGLGEVAIDRGTAEDYDLHVGSRTQVLLADGSQPDVEIVGIFTFGEANNLLGARLTAFDAAVAQEAFGAVGEWDSIDVAAEPGVDRSVLADRIQEVLPDGVEAVTTEEVVVDTVETVGGFVDIFRNGLLGFAAVALFVSAFYINNTFSITVGQRTRELSLLRSLGASRRQITGGVAGEALLVGVLASLVGVGFGLLIASVLQSILGSVGFDLPGQDLVLAGRTWVAAAVVGVGVTLVAGLAPARRAARVPPVVGMREGYVAGVASRRTRLAVGAVLVAAGALLVGVGPSVLDGGLGLALGLGGGAMAVFIGIAQLSPVVAVPIASGLGRPLRPLLRVAGRLAQANAVRSPERTAQTASALMIGLALVTTVFVVGASIKASFADAMEGAVQADYILSTGGNTGFSPALTAAVGDLPEVEAITGVRFARFLIEGSERDVVGIDPAGAQQVVDIDVRSGSVSDLRPGTILLHEDPARDLGVEVGDSVTIQLAAGGPREVEVAAVYADATFAGNYLLDNATFTEGYPANDLDLLAFLKIAPGVSPDAARSALEAVLESAPQVTLEDRDEYQESQQGQLDSLLIAVNGMLGLALLIALLGIANTLALSILERTREIGLLRAVGMLRGQVRRMVLMESVLVALLGAAIGVGVGLVFGVVATAAMPASVISQTVVPVSQLVSVVVAAGVCGVVAGLLPARRAARLQVLEAIAAE